MKARNLLRTLLLGVLAGAAWPALAACSRPIQVPMAPHGVAIVSKNDKAAGVLPDLLQSLGEAHGCKFVFSLVPRARLEMLFKEGNADLIVLSTRSPERDRAGSFVPMINYRAVLVSNKPLPTPVHTVEELVKNTELRIALVRGFDYGPAYRTLLEPALTARVQLANDLNDLMRRLQANIADVTILPYSSAYNTIVDDARLKGLDATLTIHALDDLPWQDAGFYVSSRTLAPADKSALIDLLGADEVGNQFIKGLSKAIPPKILALTARRHAK
ncbi:ABC transporter substrate-binding protein [Massilia sp. TS11]|uniref:substrate-binding periplasmic protein n=1 Tax=Massilia sp. TS11 TaxID=2908003 RepID=UPI001EDAF33E|nr:transporter substrate-binding domain-containing protein [Massilia sp. TS11]MCG2583582.1 transporter substrate-binding domain-containing protein [Massilia sp. TS11]